MQWCSLLVKGLLDFLTANQDFLLINLLYNNISVYPNVLLQQLNLNTCPFPISPDLQCLWIPMPTTPCHVSFQGYYHDT